MFFIDKLIFLGFIVSSHGIEVDDTKNDAITSWPQPINLNQVRIFLGLTGFYRCFGKDFSYIASPLHALSNNNVSFTWGPSQDKAFNELKHRLTHASLLFFFPTLTKLLKSSVMLVAPTFVAC